MALFSFIPDLLKEGFKTVNHVVSSLDELKDVIIQNVPKMFDQTLEVELRNKGSDFDFSIGVNTHKVHASNKEGDRVLVGKITPDIVVQPVQLPAQAEPFRQNVSFHHLGNKN